MKRVGQVIKVRPDKLEYYKQLHANCWPGVKAMIKECNIQHFSIFHRDGYLFSYFEYTGEDFEADMAKMYEDPRDAEVAERNGSLSAAHRYRQGRQMVGRYAADILSGLT